MKDEILFYVATNQYLFDTFVKGVGVVETLSLTQKAIYSHILEYEKKNKRCLTCPEAEILFDKPFDMTDISTEFVFDMVLREIKAEKLKYWILNIAEDIESDKVNYPKVYKELGKLTDKLEISIPKGIAADGFVSDVVAYESTKIEVDVLRSGINALDSVLRGGFHKGELAFLIAPPGRGKSAFLINLFHSLLVQKRVTLLLSNELRTEAILSRLYRRVLKRTREEFTASNKEEIEAGLNRFFRLVKGKGVIHYIPVNRWGIQEIKSWVVAWEKKFGVKVDSVIIDYFDRLRKPWGEDATLKDKALVDELRDYAVDKGIFMGVATQTNRSGLNAPLVTEEHVGGTFGKIESSDVVLSLSQNAQERAQNKGRATVLKNREYGGAGTVIDLKINWDSMLVTDLEE